MYFMHKKERKGKFMLNHLVRANKGELVANLRWRAEQLMVQDTGPCVGIVCMAALSGPLACLSDGFLECQNTPMTKTWSAALRADQKL